MLVLDLVQRGDERHGRDLYPARDDDKFWTNGPGWTRTAVENPEKTDLSEAGGARCGAPSVLPTISDPDLRRLIDLWSLLPAAVRHAILAMAKAAEGNDI